MKGPYTQNVVSGNFRRNRTWYRSDNGATHRTPLPYTLGSYDLKRYGGITSPGATSNPVSWPVGYYVANSWARDGNQMPKTFNKAYSKFRAKMGNAAMMGENLVMYRQSLDMSAKLLKAMVHPLTTLGITMKKYARARRLDETPIGDIAELWLMFHFGLQPLFHDLLATWDAVLFRQPSGIPVYGTGRIRQTVNLASGNTVNDWQYAEVYDTRVKIGAVLTIDNPNVVLANQLGLINLPALAWNLLPWSFLIDHIYGLGTFIESWSDLWGISYTDAYTTRLTIASGDAAHPNTSPRQGFKSTAVRMERKLGLEKPTPYLHMTSLSASHVATYMALVVKAAKNLPLGDSLRKLRKVYTD